MHLERRLLRLAREGRLALLVIPLLSITAGALAFSQAGILSRVISQVFLEKATLKGVSELLISLLVIFGLRALNGLLSDLSAQANARRIKAKVHERLLEKIQELGPGYVSGEQTGELNHTLDEGVEQLDAYFSQYLPGAVQALLTPLTVLLFVIQIDLLSGIIFLLTAPLIPIFMSLIGNRTRALTRQQWLVLSRLSAYFLDVLQGLPTLKILGRSKEQVKTISQASEQFREATMRVLRVTFLSSLTLETVTTLSTAVVAVQIGLRLLYGGVSYEQALIVLLLAPEFYLPLRMLGARFHAGAAGVEAMRRISKILETPPQSRELEMDQAPIRWEKPPTIRFEDVSVEYEEGRPALNGVTFEIPAGKKTALVGPSGGGKSTIAALMLRFIQAGAGQILIEKTPLERMPLESWRKRTAWVPQRPYLLNDTVEANIRLARPEASQEMVRQAAKLAEAEAFISGLPEGYQTRIGERGSRLSAGEAQRIALARAFLREADVIILDEATASLDAQNEASLQLAFKRLLEGRTTLVIAQRLNTIRDADQIIVLHEGRVVQTGKHATLLEEEGLYQRMVGSDRMLDDFEPELEEIGGDEEIITKSPAQPPILENQGQDYGIKPESQQRGRFAVFSRLIRLGSGMWGWAVISVLTGAATVLSGVGLMAASAYIITMAALHPSIALLQVAIVGVRFFGISRGIFRYLERIFSHQATFRLLAQLRTWFYAVLEPHIPARSLSYRSGDLLSRILGDIQNLENFYVRALAPPLSAVLALGVVYAYLAGFSADIALALVTVWLAGGIGLPLVIGRLGKRVGVEIVARRANLNASRVDFVQGLADLTAFGQSQSRAAELNTQHDALLQRRLKMAAIGSLQSGAAGLLANVGMWVVLALAIPLVRSAEMNGVYLAVAALAALSSFEALTPLPGAAQSMESNLQSARRLFEIADTRVEVLDPETALPMPEYFDIQVKDVSFRYPEGAEVLNRISFELKAGKRIAIVGESGSGKTTLLNLLLRLWEVEEGRILINGSDIRRYRQEDVRKRIRAVPQQVYLFCATIRDNLRIAKTQRERGRNC